MKKDFFFCAFLTREAEKKKEKRRAEKEKEETAGFI